MDYDIREIESVGPKRAEKLAAAGVTTTSDLLAKTWTSPDRKRLAKETDISTKLLFRWMNQANLMRVEGIGGEYADLLYQAGISNLLRLSRENSASVMRQVDDLVAVKPKVVRRKPPATEIETWIAQAKELVEQLDLPEEGIEDYTNALKLDDLRSEIEDALDTGNWQHLLDLGNLLRGQAFFKLLNLRERLSLAAPTGAVDHAILSERAMIEHLQEPAVQKAIKTSLQASGMPGEDIDRYLDDVLKGEFEIPGIERDHSSYYDFSAAEIEYAVFIGVLGFYLTIAGRSKDQGGTGAGAPYAIAQGLEIQGISAEQLDEARAWIADQQLAQVEERLDELERAIQDMIRAIYSALVAGRLDTLEEKTLAGLSRLETLVSRLEKVTGLADALIAPNTSPGAVVSARAGRIVEWLALCYGLCLYHTAINDGDTGNPLLAGAMSKARSLGYNSGLAGGQRVTVEQVLAAPGDFAGTRLTVVGNMVWQWDRDERLMSFALGQAGEDVPPDEEPRVLPLVLKDVEHRDLLPPKQSACLVVGELVEWEGETALDVERLDLAALGGTSWADHTVRFARRWYNLFPADQHLTSDQAFRDPETALRMIQLYYRRELP